MKTTNLQSTLRPLHNRILVQRDTAESKTPGGIVIPDNAKDKPTFGTVVAVGSGKVLDDGTVRALEVGIGDRILFGKYDGQDVEVDGKKYVMMAEDDVLGVVE